MGFLRRRKFPSPDCARVAEMLQSYLDGELDADSAGMVMLHLEECRHCGLEAATYRKLKRSLRRQGRVDDDDLVELRRFADEIARGDIGTGDDRV